MLDMLLILQRRGQATARELAEQLEVSVRTVLRDVDALSEAGIPIYTLRGSGGGIALMDGFQTDLTGLAEDEARCLFLVGQPALAHCLGLADPTRRAAEKLLAALPAALAGQVGAISDWLLHDIEPWPRPQIPHRELARLGSCIRQQRVVELLLPDPPVITVQPLGLVLKAGAWWLVVTGGREQVAEVISLDRLRATRLTRRRFDPPTGFDLGRFWSLAGRSAVGG